MPLTEGIFKKTIRIVCIFKKSLFGIFVILLLNSCAQIDSKCPSVRHYTIREQQEIVRSWNDLPDGSLLQIPLSEWQRLRQQLK